MGTLIGVSSGFARHPGESRGPGSKTVFKKPSQTLDTGFRRYDGKGPKIWGFAVCLILLSGCLRNPVTQKRQTRLISEASERAIGAETRTELVKEYGEVDDPVLRAYVNRIGQKLAAVSDRPRLDYVYTILNSDVVNAFAAPGGYIFVTRGLLQRVSNEAELAIVLGHETGHVCAMHGVTMIQKQMGAGILTLLGTVAAGVTAGPEAAVAMMQTASLFSDLYLLGYSRDNEVQADRLGLRYALSAGYDARAALTFFQHLKDLESQAGIEAWEPYLLSHPPTETRIALAKEYLDRMEEFPRPTSETAGEYADMEKRLSLMAPQGLGRVEGRRFTHPGSGASMEIPPGWVWEVHNQQVLAGFRAPTNGAWGELRRKRLAVPMRAEEFARGLALERRWKLLSGREQLYPVGYVFLGSYAGEGPMGDGYQLRVLFVTRAKRGYAVVCGSPPDKFEDFLLPFEGIMRSFNLADGGTNVDDGGPGELEGDLRSPLLQRAGDHRKDRGGDPGGSVPPGGGRGGRRVDRRDPGNPPDQDPPPGGQSPVP